MSVKLLNTAVVFNLYTTSLGFCGQSTIDSIACSSTSANYVYILPTQALNFWHINCGTTHKKIIIILCRYS